MADNIPAVIEVNGVKGRNVFVYGIKPTAEPLGPNKIVYLDSDWEWREEFIPYTEEELKQIDAIAKKQDIPNRIDTLETTQDEIVLYLADSIGGATNDQN